MRTSRPLCFTTGFPGSPNGASLQSFLVNSKSVHRLGDIKHFADIERLAMVGDKKWQHGMAMFFKPFTKATIRYFDHAEATEARKWLGEA